MRILFIVLILVVVSCANSEIRNQNEIKAVIQTTEQDTLKKIYKTDSEWKEELNEMEYYVLRKAGTERAHTGDLLNNKKEGNYTCRGCGLDLFHSDSKFKSGTGWPSFFQPAVTGHIKEDTDYNLGYARTEILCARCDGHLGHVFNDGPKPTGLRYCVNSVSLDFVEGKKKE